MIQYNNIVACTPKFISRQTVDRNSWWFRPGVPCAGIKKYLNFNLPFKHATLKFCLPALGRSWLNSFSYFIGRWLVWALAQWARSLKSYLPGRKISLSQSSSALFSSLPCVLQFHWNGSLQLVARDVTFWMIPVSPHGGFASSPPQTHPKLSIFFRVCQSPSVD